MDPRQHQTYKSKNWQTDRFHHSVSASVHFVNEPFLESRRSHVRGFTSSPICQFSSVFTIFYFFLFFPLFWVENLFLRYSRFVCHCFKIRFGWRGFFYLSSNCVQEEFFKTLERVLFLYDTTGWRTCWLFMRTQTSKRKTL